MTINMEVKKDGLRQTQDGLWKLTLTILPEDMPVDLMVAPMGSRYAMAIVPIRDDESANPTVEQTEGERLRTRAVMLCKDEQFQRFVASKLTPSQTMSYDYIDATPEQVSKEYLCGWCGVNSRSEIATKSVAQLAFSGLIEQYNNWLYENQYEDNLNRY